jgi:hypothetical protein
LTTYNQFFIDKLIPTTDDYTSSVKDLTKATSEYFNVIQRGTDTQIPYAPGFNPNAPTQAAKRIELPDISGMESIFHIPEKTRRDFSNALADMATDLLGDFVPALRDTSTVIQFTEEQLANLAPTDEELEQWKRYEYALTDISRAMNDLAYGAVQGLAGQVANLAAELGSLAVTGEFNGDAMLQSFGSFLQQLGGQMAVYGALVMAFGSTQAAFMSDPTPWGKIAEGALMLALGIAVAAAGGAISAIGGGSISAPSSGGSYGGSTYSGGCYDANRNIEFVVRGEDLVAVLNNNADRMG